MDRRDFVAKLGAGALLGAGVTACTGDQQQQKVTASEPVRQWKMVTTWPKNFPVIGTGAEYLAELITRMSGGRLKVKVYAAGELVPALECLDMVSQAAVQMGHGASYYWQGKNPILAFFSSVPFGMNALQMNTWLYYGGGLDLWEEVYEPFGVIPMPAGNTGVQMGGWFNREINTLEDFQGLKMRIPGLGGEVLSRLGVVPITLPGGELLTAMQTHAIDATEWINPYADLAFGLHKVAKYYYFPGWHELGTTLECIVNREAMQALPADLQQIVRSASRVVNQQVIEEYTARNMSAIHRLREAKVEIRRFSDEILAELRKLSSQVVAELASGSELDRRIYKSYNEFHRKTRGWLDVSEKMYYQISGS